jgi:DNA mismatch repair protein MutL
LKGLTFIHCKLQIQIKTELPDIIQLLPDNIANQIAAGEVIQRPASAVKELLENAVDAGATEIRLFVADAGKSLVQVTDNGNGMSPTDARMAFERHATSKIKNIEDLFHIRTMGFRGEALASIAAVAQVELKTRRALDETGVFIEVENSVLTRQDPVSCPVGTNIAMKNLFFNVPARRNFLKSNAAEMRHVIDEFIRVALSFPAIFFSLTSNGQELFHLEKGSLKQRIIQVLGANSNAKLVTVQQKTDYLDIYGFAGKPETAKKTRGDQYFFVNNRFIRSPYLGHAVMSAYQEMIPADSFPLYVLFIDLDPEKLDINVHPTKQEIKFEDEKIIYAFVHAALRHALAQFSITPTLDFDLDPQIQGLDAVTKPFSDEKKAALSSSSLYQTFTQKNQAHFIEPSQKNELNHWTETFPSTQKSVEDEKFSYSSLKNMLLPDADLIQIHLRYILAPTARGFVLVSQQAAHERIWYEKFLAASNGKSIPTQPSLFPSTLLLSGSDAALLLELLSDLGKLGYQIEPRVGESFVVLGTPSGVDQGGEKAAVETLLEQFKHFSHETLFSPREKLIRSMARQRSVKAGQALGEKEMSALLEDLSSCDQPNRTPDGHPTYIEFHKDYLEKLFSH